MATSPDKASAWLTRAEHMRMGKRFDAALSDVTRAIQLIGPGAPEASDAYVLQARILLEQGHIERAIEAANRALEARPEVQAYSVRGDAYFQLQNYERAVEDYQQARRLDTDVQQAYLLHADALEAKGNVEQAGYFREQAGRLIPKKRPAASAEDGTDPPPFPVDVTQESATESTPVAEAPSDAAQQ